METITTSLLVTMMSGILALMGILLLNMVIEEWDSLKNNIKRIWTKK